MADFIICVLGNLFRVYLISRFMHLFLAHGENRSCGDKLKSLLAYGGFFLANTAAFLIFHTIWVNVVCNLAGIGLIALTYTKSAKMVLFVTGSVYVVNMGCDAIVTFSFVDYKDGQGFSQVYSMITVLLVFICELITEKIVDAGRKTENIRSLSLGLVPLCSIGMFLAITYTESSTRTGLVIASIGLILINFLTFYLYNMQSDAISQQYENEALRQKVWGYANQLDVMVQGEEKLKALQHDMKHHMNELKILAAREGNRAIEEYIGSMEEFITNPNEIVSSGNLEIDSVVNYMLSRAKQELRTVNVNVRLPESVSHSFDINVILGNLLENGIEAARQTEEKRLDVSIELRQGVLRIQVENSYNGKTVCSRENFSWEKRNQRLLTTKREKGLHGIGLENVRKIVEKYDGIMEVCPGSDTFRVVLILYMSEFKD